MQPKNPIMRHFVYAHLPEKLQAVSKPVGELAEIMDARLPDGPEKSAGLRKLLEAKDCFVRAALGCVVFFCLSPFCLSSDDWQPSTRETAAYPGPIMNLLAGRGRPSCPPGQSCPPQYGPRVVPRSQQRYDAAAQQPQLPSTYSQPAGPDLSKYALKSELQNFATRADLQAVKSQIATIAADGQANKQTLDDLRTAHNKNAKTLADDLKTVMEATGAKLTELNGRIEAVAQTPAGEHVLDRGGNWLDQAVGFSATAALKAAFTFAGLPGAAAIAAAWLIGRKLRPEIQNLKSNPGAPGENGSAVAGGGGADPFRAAPAGTTPARARPAGGTDYNPRTDTDYRAHR